MNARVSHLILSVYAAASGWNSARFVAVDIRTHAPWSAPADSACAVLLIGSGVTLFLMTLRKDSW